jgi:RNA polymerase sigma factor (sigma-70 family)
MSSGESLKGVVRQLRARFGEAPTDLELLARYAHQHDEAAFAALVRRHGGLVLGTACRLLADRDQAEDVFQATFLALARSAARLGRPTSLAGWLYAVARRQARKVRLRAARRAARERASSSRPAPAPDPLAEITGRELVGLIDEELARLPEAYRLPLLLCCVQGLSREEAARQLGWSDGMVKGRLERGRRRLADRLARRGVAPSALLLAPLAADRVPDRLLARAASLAAAPWAPSVPAAVSALAGAGMLPRLLPAAVLAGSLLVVGLIGLALGTLHKEPPIADPSPPAAAAPTPQRDEDTLPAGSTFRLGTSRFRQGTAIDSLAVSADDRLAVAASGNHWLGSTRAFDLTTGRLRYTLERALFPFVEAVALSPDGRTLAAKADNTVRLYDASTDQALRKLPLPEANPRSTTSWLTFTPDGKALAVTSEGKVVHLLDVARGTLIRSFAHQNVVYAAAFSPDGRLLAAGGYDSSGTTYFARLWEVASGKELRRCGGIKGGIRTLAFSPDGATLAGGGDDGKLRLWDVATGKTRRLFPADGRRIRSVAFAPDGRTVAAAGATIRLYDPDTGRERLRIDRQALGLHWSSDGHILTAAVAGAIFRWDAATGQVLTPQGDDSAVDQIVPTPDGRRILTRDEADMVHVWDAATGKHLRRLEVGRQKAVALSPDGRLLAWSAGDPGVQFKVPGQPNAIYEGSRIRLYDLAADRFLDRFPGYEGDAWDLAFTPGGRTLVGFDPRDGTVRLWDVAAGKERTRFRVVRDGETKKSYYAWHAVLSPDGRTLAVSYQRADNTTILFAGVVVRLFDVATGKERHELTGHANQVLGMAFSPDSRLLATCGENPYNLGRPGRGAVVDRVFVWDVATGKRAAGAAGGLPLGAGSVAFAPDGRTLATASADGVIRLWEVASWTVRAEFRGHRDRVSALAFAPDGRLLSGSLDTTVLAWDTSPPRLTEGPLAAAWDRLAEAQAAPAFRAEGRLRASPAEAVALLADRLKPAAPVGSKRVAELIADLDSPKFAVRDRATAALRQVGRPAAAALREAKATTRSAEVRRRARTLLAELEEAPVTAKELRELRAVEVLEELATPAARRLLADWSRGEPGAVLTRAAALALRRLSERQGSGVDGGRTSP